MTQPSGILAHITDREFRELMRNLITRYTPAERLSLYDALRGAQSRADADDAINRYAWTPALAHWWAWAGEHWSMLERQVGTLRRRNPTASALIVWRAMERLRASEVAGADVSQAWTFLMGALKPDRHTALILGYDDLMIDYSYVKRMVDDWLKDAQERQLA